jgi:16S rRNA (cytosine967-C5)-methyltransferase
VPLVAADAALAPWRAAFDRVILDAPCTGTGTFRRHPELRWRFRASELARLAAASGHMLAALASAVASGGLLVLVTCSIEREENEAVAESFLATHDGFGREREPWRVLPGDGHDGFSVSVFRRDT